MAARWCFDSCIIMMCCNAKSQFDLASSIADYSGFDVFRSAGNKEFANEKISALLIEHNFGRLPFHALGLPLFNKLTLDFILTGGAG